MPVRHVGFLRDSVLDLNIRGFDFDREDGDGRKINSSSAIGSVLSFNSGQRRDRWSVKLYRQDINIPFVHRRDSRMIPNTYEGHVARHLDESCEFLAGHIT